MKKRGLHQAEIGKRKTWGTAPAFCMLGGPVCGELDSASAGQMWNRRMGALYGQSELSKWRYSVLECASLRSAEFLVK